MKRLFATFIIALSVAVVTAVPAFAETITSNESWTVTFTPSSKLESNYTATDIVEEVNGLQAGDTIKLTVALENKNSQSTNWYMTNQILQSMEESATSAKGAAYSYDLAYIDPDGVKTVLFSSEQVGGDEKQDGREGLYEATGALEDYFLLGTLKPGQDARVTLDVSLDGETQGNAYQDSLADLALDFAVEFADSTPVMTPSTLPQTGDMIRIAPLFALCGIAGLIMLLAGFFAFRRRRDDDGEVA